MSLPPRGREIPKEIHPTEEGATVGPNYLTIGASGGPGLLDHCQPQVIACWLVVQRRTSDSLSEEEGPPLSEREARGVVLAGTLDPKLFTTFVNKGLDEAFCQLEVGDQGDVAVDGSPANEVIIGQLFLIVAFGDVDYEVELASRQAIQDVRRAALQGPMDQTRLDAMLCQKVGG